MIDVVASVFGIVSGIVLALFAVFAFFVQRARLVREFQPDLRAYIARNARIEPTSDLEGRDVRELTLQIRVTNESESIADEVECLPQEARGVVLPRVELIHVNRLLPREHIDFSVWAAMDPVVTHHLVPGRPGAFERETVSVVLSITYTMPREAVTWIISPHTFGRLRFSRQVAGVFARKTTGPTSGPEELDTETFVQI